MKKISNLRIENGNLSQKQLANKLKVTQPSICRWEQDQTKITGSNLVKLAKFFDVSVDELLGIEIEEE